MRLAGWLSIALSFSAVEPPPARAADPFIEEVWDRTEENALRGPRALLFTGSLLAVTSLGSAFVGYQRAREVEECRDAVGWQCTDLQQRQNRRHQVSAATSVLAIAAIGLLVSGGAWLAQRKHTRAATKPVVTTPLVLVW